MATLRGAGPFAFDTCSYNSAASDLSANLDPLSDVDQRNILAKPFISVNKMEANNNYEKEDLKNPTDIGDTQNPEDPQQGDEDDSGDEEVWESVSELASDEEYVTDDGDEEEGEEVEFEEEEDDDDDDDDDDGEDDDDSMAEEEEEEEEDVEGDMGIDDATMSSGDEGGEKCAICLCAFRDQEVGMPESCDHTFCFECIYEWSKNVTTCPVDRSVFTLILVRNTIHGEIVRQMEVKAQEAIDEDQDPTYCEVCGECDREDRLLLCDECDAGYHCECLTPPLVDIPIEEWYCPNCATANHDDVSSEEEYMADLRRPLRRVREYARAIARTQVAERVLSRVRQARELRRIDEEEQAGTSTATRAPRVPKPRRKTTRKRKSTKRKTTKRKTTKRKTTKRKTTKRKTTKRKKSSKTTSSTTATGTKKKRRKTTRRRRKRKVRRTSVGARTAQPSVAKTIRRRIAGKLNLVSPKVGSMMPDMKQKGEHSLLFKRHDIGVASLTLTGGDHIFDPSGYDESPIIRGPGAQSAPTPAKPLPSAAPGPSSGGGALDLLGSILQGQNILHMKSENITIHKDGTLSSARKKDGAPSPKKSPTKTAHRPSTSSTTSHHHNSEKLKSNSMKPATHNYLQGQRSSQHQGQRRSESSRQDSSSKRMSQEIDYDDGIDDLELVEMDIDDDDEDVGGGGDAAFMEDLRHTSKRESSREASQHDKHWRQGSNTNSEITRTKGNVDLDSVRSQFAPHSTEEKHQGSECEDQDENENDESDGDVGYHGNSDNQGGEEDGGYQQEGEGGDEDDGNHDENTVNNNNNNNGDGGDGGEEGEGGGEDGGEGDGEGEEHDEDNEEEAEEEEEEEEEVEGEIEEEHAPESNKKEEAYAEAEDEAEIYEEAEVEKEEPLDENNDREYDPADDVAEENEGDKEYDPAMPIEGYLDGEEDSLQEGEDSNQTDICEDGGEKEEDQADEEEVEDEQEIEDEEEEDVQEEEEQEEDEQDEAQEEQEIQQSGPEVVNTVNDQNREEQNLIEEGLGRGDGANEELKEDEEEEDGEAEEGEELDEEHNSQEMANVNDKSQEETDEMKLKPGIGKLECEDISDEDNVPEGDGDEVESDEEGMIIETSDGRFIEAKPKSKTSRTPRRSEQSDTRETSAEVTESDVKHGPSSAEEGEVKTDDESKKGKKTRGKRKRKPKKRNRDKRNVVVDPRKSISLHPQMPPDLSRLPKRGEEPSSRREGSRESYGDLRQVIQVKRDTPYTAEELRRYHEEYWEEYNRRRDERRVERVGSSWDQYTYDQYAYYEAWRSMGGEFATGRPWGLHVQRDRSPIYDRRKNGAEPQVFDPRLEALRQSQRKESERGKEEGPGKSGEKKPKSDSDSSRKDQTTKKDGSRSQKDEKDKLKKEKTKEKSKGLVHENSARDKNGRERGGGERDKRIREKEKVREKENHDKHGHDREKDRSRHKEREKSRERERSRKDSDHRSRDKERHRSPVRERSRDRGRERSRDRYHKKSRDTERSRSKDNDHSRSRHRSRSRDRSRDRSRKRDRSSESDRVSSRDRRKDKPRDKVQDRGREKDIRTSRNQDKGKERERSRDTVRTKKTEEMKSTSSSKVPLRKERGKVTVDASGVRKILLGEKSKPKEPKKVVEKPATAVVKVEKMKVKKIKKDKAGGENKVEKKGKKTKVKGEKKLTKGKKKKAAAKRPLSFDVDEIAAPPVKKKATSAAVVQAKKIEDVVLKPPSPLKVDDAEDMVPVPSTTRSVSHSPDLYIDIAVPDNDLSRIAPESPKVVFKAKSPTDVAVADSSHLENDMYDPFEPTASPPSGIKSPSPIPSEASPRHDTATSSSLEVFATKRATTPPPEVPPNPTSTTDVSSSDMATNPSQTGMTNEDRLMLASQASQQITKILNQLATVPVTKPPRVSPESPDELAMSSASIELGLSPEHIRGSSLSVSSLGSDHKNFKVEPIMPEDNAGDGPEDDIEMSAVDLYNKNSRDRYLKKLYHQERVVEEVKLAIKPHYQRKVINKEDYKEILRKSVTQVCHSKTGEINPVKIRRLIDGYVKKAQHKNKKPSGGDGHKSSKQGGGSAGKSGFKSSSRGPSKGSSKASKEPASASKLIEKGRSLGLKSK